MEAAHRSAAIACPGRMRRAIATAVGVAAAAAAAAGVIITGAAADPARMTVAAGPGAGTIAKFTILARQQSNRCSLRPAELMSYPPGRRLQGSCCSPMNRSRYQHQLAALRRYAAIPQSPPDAYDIPVGRALQLLALDRVRGPQRLPDHPAALAGGPARRAHRRCGRLRRLRLRCCAWWAPPPRSCPDHAARPAAAPRHRGPTIAAGLRGRPRPVTCSRPTPRGRARSRTPAGHGRHRIRARPTEARPAMADGA